MREQDTDMLSCDALLNEALRTYADPGPESGLEHRMFARLAEYRYGTEPRAIRRAWLWFAVPASAFACMVLAVVLVQRHDHPAPQAVSNASAETPVKQEPQRRTADVVNTRRAARKPHLRREQTSAAKAVPQLAMFPSLPRLTPEERALMEWQKNAPESARKAFVEGQSQPDLPRPIAALSIAPLETPALGSE